jgi:predicted NAD/FAD-dependent oxidoreductase
MDSKADILILGAGISGLIAGATLREAGHKVTLLEKSRGPGGRMATRRFGGGVFDHGAQFFTVRDPRFQTLVRTWEQAGIVREWWHGFSSHNGLPGSTSEPRYRGVKGMTSAAKYLSRDLDVQLNTRATSISTNGSQWRVTTEDERQFNGTRLILTPPVPQSLALLEAGGINLPAKEGHDLEAMQYDPCIAVLAILDGRSAVPSPGGMQIESGLLRWLADNTQKGISPNRTAITLHASPEYSRQQFEATPQSIAESLLREASPWLSGQILDWQVHKWRYSQPAHSHPERFLKVPGSPGLYFAGDSFGGPRVEGAVLSGLAAAEDMMVNHD